MSFANCLNGHYFFDFFSHYLKICKDKVEAELWLAGLNALVSSGQCGRSKIDGWTDGGLVVDVIFRPELFLPIMLVFIPVVAFMPSCLNTISKEMLIIHNFIFNNVKNPSLVRFLLETCRKVPWILLVA